MFSRIFGEHFPDYVPLTVLLFAYTLYPNVGRTVQTCFQGTLGTLLACLNIWALHRFFPGGITPGMKHTDCAVIVGYLDTFAFLFAILEVGFDTGGITLDCLFSMVVVVVCQAA